MSEKQRTIKSRVSYSGIGLHTGESSTITFNPAPENYGYRFVRTDIEPQVEIPAIVDNVVDLSRGTTLGIGEVKVHTVEHVLASLVGLRIDNCKIELSGIEPPVGDGSSLPYVEVLLKAGFEEQNEEREFFVVEEAVRYKNDDKEVDIVALPTNDYRITVMVDYHNPALGSQHTGVFNLEEEFVEEFAPARTFCFLTELQMLQEQGLIKGGQLDNALVIIDKDISQTELEKLKVNFNLDHTPVVGTSGYLDNRELRFKNEPARHKLLDMLGDLSLIGVPIKAQILAARPGHASNIEFAKKIRQLYLKFKKISQFKAKDTKSGVVLDIKGLLKIMPHRYPFLLIDKVLSFDTESKTVVGVKNVTMNEEFFQGHFPDNPVMPGVLITESMAQTGCLLIINEEPNWENKLVLFMGIKNAKFRKPVIPGDQLILTAKLIGKKLGAYFLDVTATVDGQIVAQAELQTAVIEK
ncbi:bifunctional UDP-3-O-[3-hydroxymyristoyl] N-acetylglucosamine deacetylase/3-hydroxyacyl-ACP dehydratase [Bacteroidetes/Chlorobi group bacterium ChocPot_Mid]|jgi:UDP-3-O-[3-hydroxymyristoyl] N-acetylglucosamine deacetylase/3-hydroxyacyl-[acyl-carrier-protein] dehydratase|nr:MAG: bifunctional UDP-3-O-[3-hydroxymyristoyl] N-acetylglucosamine deacetylase/3-hydroxyacyl-ACP dehydratase [Bacteroidetes/Chlorobi group bacterium ChocPot_Mid]